MRSLAFLQAEWIPILTDCRIVSIDSRQPGLRRLLLLLLLGARGVVIARAPARVHLLVQFLFSASHLVVLGLAVVRPTATRRAQRGLSVLGTPRSTWPAPTAPARATVRKTTLSLSVIGPH